MTLDDDLAQETVRRPALGLTGTVVDRRADERMPEHVTIAVPPYEPGIDGDIERLRDAVLGYRALDEMKFDLLGRGEQDERATRVGPERGGPLAIDPFDPLAHRKWSAADEAGGVLFDLRGELDQRERATFGDRDEIAPGFLR